jgi:hypothetical protein
MSLLQSRQRRSRFSPQVEVLEGRFLLNATLTGNAIKTTGAVNHVLITDSGTTISVFSDNGLVGTRAEGTPLTLIAGKKGSSNFVEYYLLGSTNPNAPSATTLDSTLTVNFGTGNGQLLTNMVASLPTMFGGPVFASNLGMGSNVHVAATSSRGNTQDTLICNALGNGASLSDVDHGGKGNDIFDAFFPPSTESGGASVNLAFFGGKGNNSTDIDDGQDINAGASTTINVSSHGGLTNREDLPVGYIGQLQGSLSVDDNAGRGTGNVIGLFFTLNPGSSGALTSSAKTGPGPATVTDTVHKVTATDTPTVFETAQGIGKGAKTLKSTNGSTTGSVAVTDLGGFSTLVVVP